MASIPNLNTLRTGRGGPRRRAGRGGAAPPDDVADLPGRSRNDEAARDKIIQQTDHDASSSRMSAVALGYLHDPFASPLFPTESEAPKRYPIINRGTYVRTQAIDRLVIRFVESNPQQKKQIISLGAGSDTRFWRLWTNRHFQGAGVVYHELDFESNVNQKRTAFRANPRHSTALRDAEKEGAFYHLHALDLRDLTAKCPPEIPHLDPDLPTLLLSECCLCYLSPDVTSSILQYFTMHLREAAALVLYEPIRPFDAFGKTMVSNLASRGIHLQTLKRYCSLDAQRLRLKAAGFEGGQGARDVHQLWESEDWTAPAERERVERLEWLDEMEEWHLLASHYCVAWGWRGTAFTQAWNGLAGSRTTAEDRDDAFG